MKNVFILIAFIGLFCPMVQGQSAYQADQRYMPDQEPLPTNLQDITRRMVYPQAALHAGLEGMVQVMVWVDADGRYQNHKLVGNASPLLRKTVDPYIRELAFRPAIIDGRPVRGKLVIPFRFKIRYDKLGRIQGFIISPYTNRPENNRLTGKLPY